jgi:hypothetical protein
MKRQISPVLTACGTLIASGLLLAQSAANHAPDGGTMQRLQSIDIPATPNAPFSAVVTTEWTRIMPDGSTATMKNHRTIARDSSGKVFQERRYFSPNGDTQETRLSELDYQDPSLHQMTICRPDVQVCTVYRFDAPAPGASSATKVPQSVQQNGMSSVSQEQLGNKMVGGLELVGSREITTLNSGAIGNEKPQPIVKEFWYSPVLGINVSTKRMDPRASAIQDFEVGSIHTTEPDGRLFQPPASYRVLRMDGQ